MFGWKSDIKMGILVFGNNIFNCKYKKMAKLFICRREAEGRVKCAHQCIHCKSYYSRIEKEMEEEDESRNS